MTDHLPEVPRYCVFEGSLHRWAGVPPHDLAQAGYREIVLYADHLAAVQQAERISSKVIADFQRQAREAALREACGELNARIDREDAEGDGDGLLSGLIYARDWVYRLIDGEGE